MASKTLDSFHALQTLSIEGQNYEIFSLNEFAKANGSLERLPFSSRIMLENLLRHEDGRAVTAAHVSKAALPHAKRKGDEEIAFTPARVLMQDFTGVPAIVDLAAMRDAMKRLGGDPQKINPLVPVDLVIDHSVQVDRFATADAFAFNTDMEYQRNRERYTFLRWGQKAFKNFRVVPPGTGIVHQVNLEHLAPCVMSRTAGKTTQLFPDTLVGTDSHTTMINGLGVVGWGVGGIEAEAAMLGQPLTMLIPDVIGFKLTGKLPEGVTATDVVLVVTEMLRKKGVVGKFVEFYGPGLSLLTVADRATIANMAPEYGATIGFFPVDEQTLRYLHLTGRPPDLIRRVDAYTKAQGLFRTDATPDPEFSDRLSLDLGTVEASIAGPKRPQDRVRLKDAKAAWQKALPTMLEKKPKGATVAVQIPKDLKVKVVMPPENFELEHGSVVIAAITSCTNTSNPSVMVAAGLVAKKAVEKGLTRRPWVKTSLAPGSKVVIDYLQKTGLLPYLEKLGFNLVGFGCTTCIGNSGPLPDPIAEALRQSDIVAAAVLSGNRNFEGRINAQVKANYLASPPLVVAYALAGKMTVDLTSDAIGFDNKGKPVYLKDLWPTNAEIGAEVAKANREMFLKQYKNVFDGDERWKALPTPEGELYTWDGASTYVKNPPYFDGMAAKPGALKEIKNARVLAMLGDSVTTDHISPAGSIPQETPAGEYLTAHGVDRKDFNSYGARRGNDEVMVRGTFANIRLKNQLAPGTEGGFTVHLPDKTQTTLYEASVAYKKEGTPLIILAGKEYGSGSSRDWAAKGPSLLGVRAVIAESYERIHRSNLVGMGVLPLQFKTGDTRETLGLTGEETYTVTGFSDQIKPKQDISVEVKDAAGNARAITVTLRIDTPEEVLYYRNGGILSYVLRQLLAN
jgi:aconitate hydratase